MSHTGVFRSLFVVSLMGAAPLFAQSAPSRQTAPALQTGQAPAPAPPPSDSDQPYQPPAMRFEATGITLLDALTLTLQHDPNIKLRQADIDLQAGIVREQKGLFDSTFTIDGNFSRVQSELLDTVKADE